MVGRGLKVPKAGNVCVDTGQQVESGLCSCQNLELGVPPKTLPGENYVTGPGDVYSSVVKETELKSGP